MLILQIGRILRCKQGFTFLEILIVLVIMSLVLSIVIPNFNQMFASVEGAREGSKVMHLLEKMRAEAIFTAKDQKINFEATGRCTFVFRDRFMQYEDLRMAVTVDDEETESVVQTFYPNGIAELPQMIFKTDQGGYITYNFNPINGKIEMERSSTL